MKTVRLTGRKTFTPVSLRKYSLTPVLLPPPKTYRRWHQWPQFIPPPCVQALGHVTWPCPPTLRLGLAMRLALASIRRGSDRVEVLHLVPKKSCAVLLPLLSFCFPATRTRLGWPAGPKRRVRDVGSSAVPKCEEAKQTAPWRSLKQLTPRIPCRLMENDKWSLL